MAAHMKVYLVFLPLYLCCILLTCHAQVCNVPGHDMGNLTANTWQFNSNGSSCLSNNTDDQCIFNMRFCTHLKLHEECGENVSVCETLSTEEKDIGVAGFTDKPFQEFQDRSEGFKTTFPLGSKYTYEDKDKKMVTCTLNTTINFLCNTMIPWLKSGDDKTPQMVPVAPEIQLILGKDICQYNITFGFAGACAMIFPSIPTNHNLSAGSVLVIMFFVFLMAYFVFGSMWNIGCRGARGKEVIPNLDFWTMLPVYVADGFLFTFKCGQVESSSYESI